MSLPFLPAVKKNWAKLQKSGKTSSGVYTIDPDGSGAVNVLEGSVAFHRSWTDNKNGFGNLWLFLLGLDRIYRLTTMKNKLREDLMAFKWNTAFVLSNALSTLT